MSPRERDFERLYRALVATPTGQVDHYVQATSAEEAAEAAENDDRWRDRRPVRVVRVLHGGKVVWTPAVPDPLDAPRRAGRE